jgi:hypothetical protein
MYAELIIPQQVNSRSILTGVLDTSSIVAGAAPPSNTDSLFIGITGSTTPYKGVIDEARIWNRALSFSEITRYYRTSLGTSSGKYNGLVMSITFQQNEASGAVYHIDRLVG